VAAVAVLIPYAVYVFAPFFVPRNLAASVPFASLAAAAALMELLMRIPQRVLAGALMVAAAVVLVVVGATMSWRLTAERSGFAAAATYIRQHDGGRALTTSEVMVYYLGSSGDDCGAPALPLTLQSLDGYVRHGFIYAVLERHHSSVSRYVHRHALRVVRIPATGRLSIGENPISTENSNPPNAARHTEYVDVFRLDRLRLPAPPPHFDPECGRDSVT
jgi:hypothetical protein